MLDQNLDAAIREFVPTDGNWRELDRNLELAFGSPNPKVYYHAIFNLFERFPDACDLRTMATEFLMFRDGHR